MERSAPPGTGLVQLTFSSTQLRAAAAAAAAAAIDWPLLGPNIIELAL